MRGMTMATTSAMPADHDAAEGDRDRRAGEFGDRLRRSYPPIGMSSQARP